MNPHDPFLVTTKEKLRFEQQFNALQPVNGFVTGAQAKGFFLKSGLSPVILGQIWALADTDADGKMNLIEFSIACKLISAKLKNVPEVPKQLPPTLIASLQHIGTPIRTPTGQMSPTESYKQFLTQQPVQTPPTMIQTQPNVINQGTIVTPQPQLIQQPTQSVAAMQNQPVHPNQLVMMNANQGVAVAPQLIQQQIIPQQIQSIPQQQAVIPEMVYQQQQPAIIPSAMPIIPQAQPQMYTAPTSVLPTQPVVTSNEHQLSSGSLLENLAQNQPTVVSSAVLPPAPTPPQSGHASRSMSFSEKAPSIPESPSMEWSVPQSSKLKYTQMFNAADKTRSGFLTGTQARGILLQTNVPQANLAKIWALSDRDADGRLGCEEFVLALYLCEMFATGKPIPNELPADLIPPSFRKSTSRTGSLAGSRHGSISSQGASAINEVIEATAGMPHSSFEDKRKENYDKGQAELERRRKQLADIQKKEQEERERKEREEAERREKARIEAELKKQQEIEREIQRQKELEQERAEQRIRELEKKEQARKELEKQRQIEWESQKLQEMEMERQKEQGRLLKLKGHNQALSIELETLSTKVKELSQKICDTRVAVTNVKSTIDGMRTTRDTLMSDQTQCKAKIKEQNAKLVHLSQEKAKLDAKAKAGIGNGDEQAYITNKQIQIKQLKDKIENVKVEVEEKSNDFTTHKDQKTEIRKELDELITNCENLYFDYDKARMQVLELRNNRKNENLTSTWDAKTSNNTWQTEEAVVETTRHIPVATASTTYTRYQALYEFFARNSDEISFQAGDIIMVPNDQNAEPGWLAGEINGQTGWFPESYVQKCEEEAEQAATEENIEYAPPTAENLNGNTSLEGEKYISCYPYQSAEAGDLNFDIGEIILVVKKEGDWWTGVIGNNTGMFPANYVQVFSDNNTNEVASNLSQMNINGSGSNQDQSVSAEDASHQADVDSEVSQINTQNVVNDANMQEFRGMTSSASLRAKKGEVAQAIAPYEATSAEQLSLQKGQLIMVTKKTDSGWWEGELQSKGRRRQKGWFPATYVKILAGGKISGRSTPLSSSKINLHETVIDKVQAMYPYRALNDDELSFEPDDIISVLSRDEPDWWRGELNGITGLFPSNYVRAFVSSGKKT